jgi:hypothetical protein
MSLTPTLPNPLGSTVIRIVLSHPIFASRGYLWGNNGDTWYCFVNPSKLSFEIWKKRVRGWPFVAWAITALVTAIAAGVAVAGLVAFETLVIPLLLVPHYALTGEEQNAPVVTNGPQMKLPGNMQFGTVALITVLLAVVPTIGAAIIGGLVGTSVVPGIGTVTGAVWGSLVGVVSGANLVALFLFILGLGATPFGSVFTRGFQEVINPAEVSTYYFGRNTTGFAGYRIGPLNPSGLNPASGGLTAMIVNGAQAHGAGVTPDVSYIYDALVGDPRPVVVWGLLPFNLVDNPWITEAIASQAENYQGKEPTQGLLLIVGSEAWSGAHTAAMISAGVKHAAATDGSYSAMLGSESTWVIGAPSIFNIGTYRDPIQRYGFKAA